MENNTIPFIVWEAEKVREERERKRRFIFEIVMFVAFVLSNMYWIHRENSFEDVVETTVIETIQDSADGGMNYIGRIINDAETSCEDNQDY